MTLSPDARALHADADGYLSLARASTREQFSAACAFPLLVCLRERVDAAVPGRTAHYSAIAGKEPPALDGEPLVLAVRKRQRDFATMITIGRTRNHDITIPDWSVSRFHAFFPVGADGQRANLSIVDAGSRNGTWVDGRRLVPREASGPISLGARVRLGRFHFTLVDARACWDMLAATAAARSRELTDGPSPSH